MTKMTANNSEIERIPIKLNHQDLQVNDLKVLNDKVSRRIFNCEKGEWEDVVTNKTELVVSETEPRSFKTAENDWMTSSKEIAEIKIRMRIKNTVEECIKYRIVSEPLNNFDKAVLEACMAHQYQGKEFITLNTILKYLGGTRQLDSRNSLLRQAIRDSVDKLRFIDIRLDLTQAYEKLKRLQKPDGSPIREFKNKSNLTLEDYLDEVYGEVNNKKANKQLILSNYLLPAKVVTIEVDGQRTSAVKFLDISPLFLYAEDKGETELLEQKLLKPPKLNNTPINIRLKNYILTRIKSIKRSQKGGGKSLQSIIRFDSIYKNCGDADTVKYDRKFRKRVREAAFKYLNFLKEKHEINGFECLDDSNKEHSKLADCTKFKIELC